MGAKRRRAIKRAGAGTGNVPAPALAWEMRKGLLLIKQGSCAQRPHWPGAALPGLGSGASSSR